VFLSTAGFMVRVTIWDIFLDNFKIKKHLTGPGVQI
jgi:hypothetical protein